MRVRAEVGVAVAVSPPSPPAALRVGARVRVDVRDEAGDAPEERRGEGEEDDEDEEEGDMGVPGIRPLLGSGVGVRSAPSPPPVVLVDADLLLRDAATGCGV